MEHGTIRSARRGWLLGWAALLIAAPAAAAQISGVHFPEHVEARDTRLSLNGLGLLRYKVVFKGYVAALYLGDRVGPDSALEDVPRRLEIEYFWPIPAAAFAEATTVGIARNVDGDELALLRGSIEQLNALYRDVAPGDRYSLTYLPGVGTELAKNGEPIGLVEGSRFSAALFSIWIGDRPLDDALREALLATR